MTSRRNTKLKSAHKSARRVQHETLERRELLAAELDAPQLIAVSANSGEQFDLQGSNLLSTAPNELKFRFGGDLIDDATLAGIQFKRSLGDSSFEPEANGPGFEVVTPGFLGFEDNDGTNIIVARFAETLPDDFYRVELSGINDPTSQLVALADIDGDLLDVTGTQQAGVAGVQTIDFEVEVGPRVVAVVPQPIEGTTAADRVQQRDQIFVYFNEDPLSNPGGGVVRSSTHTLPVVTASNYKLFFTGETVENTDDLVFTPTEVEYDPSLNRARLTFADDLENLLPNDGNGDPILAGTYRLRVGSSDALPAVPSVVSASGGSDDTFDAAISLGTPFSSGTQSVVVTEGLIQSTNAVIPDWPGAFDAPGTRDNRRDVQRTGQIDTTVGINIFPYNFARIYGQDPQQNVLDNAITDAQKQRFREVLDLYSERLGVEFVETEDQGLQIVTGDIRSIVISADQGAGANTPLSIYRVNERDQSQGVLVMDAGENWYDGYGLSPDNRLSYFEEALRGVGNLLGIGNAFELPAGVAAGGSSPDEPNSVAFTDQYLPNLPIEPEFLSQSDITIGQALHRPESNDVDFYSFTAQEAGEISIETIAERLDGSSLLDTNLHLYRVESAGVYELVARNDDFYSEDSFIGVDIEPGDYIIGVSASGNDQYNGLVSGSGLGGTSEGKYEVRITFKSSAGQTITDSTGTELDGDADGVAGGDFNFWFRVAPELNAATPNQPKTIFVDKNGNDLNDGTLTQPKRTIQAALELANENDIVRILPNGGVDGLLSTQEDNLAFEIGIGGATNAPLRDGAEFVVPKGVSVVIDAGALFKLKDAKISVGSVTIDDDRSLANLQVLGTPVIPGEAGTGEVFFTSWDDESLGQDSNPLPTTPQPGQWGGIEFRNDFDYSEGRAVWETEGIFLDYVSHANIQFGGGSIDVNSPIVTPLQMNESRPTLIYNTIQNSADAAISADPNSFLETNFNSPLFQRAAMFTSDYDRVGPEISGNRLLGNSINGLFVRVATPAAGELEPMTVSGRFDDQDIVHVLSQVLVLQGQPGGPLLLEERPDVLSVTLTPASGGSLTENETYSYRVTYVTADGNESLASLPTASAPASAGGAFNLTQLAPAPDGFVGRNLYRSIPGTANFEFVSQLDRVSTSYLDDGSTRGGLLKAEIRPNSVPVAAEDGPGGSLAAGTSYSYRFTFVNDFGGETSASDATVQFTAQGSGSIRLTNVPVAPAEFIGTRVYRSIPGSSEFELVDEIADRSDVFDDTGRNVDLPQRVLLNDGNNSARLLPRFDARLSIDPGLVIKLQSSRIEAGFGADFIAEGADGNQITFTSRLDDTFGAGGTFDTNNDGVSDNAAPGDWGGLVFRQDASASLDFVEIRYGGGSTAINGQFTEFNAVEILQADVRIANSKINDNADGFVSQSIRGGIGFNDAAAIFVRGSQPILVGNVIESNEGAAISINPDSLNHISKLDQGRSTGDIEIYSTDKDNQGPLIAGNMLDQNSFNAVRVRSEVVTTDSVWDDTDIVHYVAEDIVTATHHYHGSLRLQSDPDQSLVVKFDTGAELIGTGRPLDIEDRIGGTLQVLGTPGNPVVLTSINDCDVGAGFTANGEAMNDTLNSGECSAAAVIDVVILFDDTGSFQQAGSVLSSAFPGLVAQLTDDLPNADLAFGIARFEDYSSAAFLSEDDRPFILSQPILATGEDQFGQAMNSALNRVAPGFGGDGPESGIEALWQIATGEGFDHDGDGDTNNSGPAGLVETQINPGTGGDVPAFSSFTPDPTGNVVRSSGSLGGVGWRTNADAKIVILATDIQFAYQNDGQTQYTGKDGATVPATAFSTGARLTTPGGRGATIQETVDRLVADGIQVVGLGNGNAPQASLEALATLTGAVDGNGAPLFFPVQPDNADDISGGVVSAITGIVSNPSLPGDWQGIRLDSFINDRNVAYVLEGETADAASIGSNAIANDAQVLGSLAAGEFQGDENERLGFNVRGTLATHDDQDVYGFTATGGTGVYIDIDETSVGLDTVVELINTNNQVLATSDNSFDEARDPSLLGVSSLPAGTVQPLYQLGTGNVESANRLDAGMRIILPGSSDSENEYFIRVSSKNRSFGSYLLSVRLRETQEIAGSTIQLADIRYATDAITVSAAPVHSPLTGTAAESLEFSNTFDPTPASPNSGDEYTVENFGNRLGFTNNQADRLGNLVASDRGSLVVSGDIGNLDSLNANVRLEDIDVYQVDLFTQQIEPDVFDSENRFVTTTFDIDYADGLGRANTSIAVYDINGRLVLHSRDSNIADDRARPLNGVDSANLAGGSVGSLDAYIGPVELPEGTYFVAVSNAATVPTELDQFFNPTAANTNIRLIPANSTRRLVDDGLDDYNILLTGVGENGSLSDIFNYTAERPIIEPVFDYDSIVPYTLEDMRLFVSLDSGYSGNNSTGLVSVNPVTGVVDRLIGQSTQRTADIATRIDGELFNYTIAPPPGAGADNGNIGNYRNVSPVNAAVGGGGDDGIAFSRTNAAGDGMEADDAAQLIITAIGLPPANYNYNFTTGYSQETVRGNAVNAQSLGFVVGNRDTTGRGDIPVELTRNIVYAHEIGTGEITSLGSDNANAHRQFGQLPYRTFFGPASADIEFGIVDTGFIYHTGGDAGDIQGIAYDPDNFGILFAATDNGGIHSFDPRDNISAPLNSPTEGYNRVIPTTFHGVVEKDPIHAAASVEFFGQPEPPPEFSGLSFGPSVIENEEHRRTLFMTTTDGWLYAVTIDDQGLVKPANILSNGRSAVQMSFAFDLGTFNTGLGVETTGLAFGNLQGSPWHQTADRNLDDGRGIKPPVDNSREELAGGGFDGLYYGFEVNGGSNNGGGNPAGNTLSRADGDDRGELAPGGSHGSVISRPINLEGYSPSDKPTLYFSYFLEVEDNDDYRPGRDQRDSFRVFAAGDDGLWQLLATNNDFRALPASDEYDYFNQTGIPVQELFDDSDSWRQARVDLSPLAGSENVRVRFDFSTAGAMQAHFDSVELVAIPGDEVADGQLISFDDDTGDQVLLENVVGTEVLFPAGDLINDGEVMTLNVAGVDSFSVTFVASNAGDGELAVQGLTGTEVAEAVIRFLDQRVGARDLGNGRVRFEAVNALTVLGDSPIGEANPVYIEHIDQEFDTRSQLSNNGTGEVRDIHIPVGAAIIDGDELQIFDGNNFTTYRFVETLTGIPQFGVTEVLFSPFETADEVARNLIASLTPETQAIYLGDGEIALMGNAFVQAVASSPSFLEQVAGPIQEGRVELTVPAGFGLNANEVITIKHAAGTTRLNVTTTPNFGLPADVVNVVVDLLATPFEVATAIRQALPVSAGAFVTQGGFISTQLSIIASSVTVANTPVALSIGEMTGREVTVPDGNSIQPNETITIRDDNVEVSLLLVESNLPGPVGTVSYEITDTAADIAARIAAALSPTAEAIVNGDVITIYGATSVTSDDPASLFAAAPLEGIEIAMPDADELVDGETIDITIGAGTITITFVDAAVAAPGEVNFQVGDTSEVLATRLSAALAGQGIVNVIDTPRAGALNNLSNAVRFFADTADYSGTGLLSPYETLATNIDGTGLLLPINLTTLPRLRNELVLGISGPANNNFTETILFIERGQSVDANLLLANDYVVYFQRTPDDINDPGVNPLFTMDAVLLDVHTQLINQLAPTYNIYVDPQGQGLFITDIGFSQVLGSEPSSFDIGTQRFRETAVPLTFPAPSAIEDGTTLTIRQEDDLTGGNEFVLTLSATASGAANEVVYGALATAAELADAVLAALPLELQAYRIGQRQLYLLNGQSVTSDTPSGNPSNIASYEAQRPGTAPILVDNTMSTREVAERLQLAFGERLSVKTSQVFDQSQFQFVTVDEVDGTNEESFSIYGGDRLRLFDMTPTDVGGYGLSSYSLFEQTPLPADEFGVERPVGYAGSQQDTQAASNNEVEGVYIDDIIIGFAERGEMVLEASNDQRDFTFNPETLPDSHPTAIQPERQNEALVGPYTLEIRTSDEFGVPQDYFPINLETGEAQSGLGRSFDTNDRLVNGAVSLIAPSGTALRDDGDIDQLGADEFVDTFVLSDGWRTLTFEFDADGNVGAGNVAVPFDPADPDAAKVARAIRQAINSTQVQGVLDITAATSDGQQSGENTGNRIELFGSSNITVNAAAGRFIKLDLVAAETSQGRETSRQIPVVDQVAETADLRIFGDELDRSTPSGFVDAQRDTLVAIGKIGDAVFSGQQAGIGQDGALILASDPSLDFDSVRIYLAAGETVDIDVDSAGFSRAGEILDLPVITVFDAGEVLTEDLLRFDIDRSRQSSLFEPTSADGEAQAGAFLRFTADESGFYDVVVSASNLFGAQAMVVPEFLSGADLIRTVQRFDFNGPVLDQFGNPIFDTFREQFSLTSGTSEFVYEFTLDGVVESGNVPILVDAADGPEVIAEKMRTAIAATQSTVLEVDIDGRFLNVVQTGPVPIVIEHFGAGQNGFFGIGAFIGSFTRAPDFGEYALTVRPPSDSGSVPARDVLMVDYQFGKTDANRVQDQGQVIIASNFITESSGTGVVAVSNERGQRLVNQNGLISPDTLPNPGSARVLRNLNQDSLIPGVVIINNVIADSGVAGIEFGGDVNNDGTVASPAAFGRIVNNTIVNRGSGDGVRVSGASSPTLLNNIFSGLGTGIAIEANQFGEVVVGGNAFHSNQTDSDLALATSSFVIPANEQLFEDRDAGNFIPAAGSRVIDSSFASLNDRSEFLQTVKQPVGISPSPIIAPRFDAYGQQRVDDPLVATPGGVGENVFIDRGAIDRADDIRPSALLTGPQDAIGIQIAGGDQDQDASFVRLEQGTLPFFEVQLVDPSGTGINPETVNANTVILTENGNRLLPNTDYIFGYSSNSNTIRLTPLTGIWRPDAVYEITLNNKPRFEVSLPAGDAVLDGDLLVVTESDGTQTPFEFDAGYIVELSAPTSTLITFDISGGDVNDGEMVEFITAGGITRTFEFDRDGSVSANAIQVDISTSFTSEEIRDALFFALFRIDPSSTTFESFADVLGISPSTIGTDGITFDIAAGDTVTTDSEGVETANSLQGSTLSYSNGAQTVTFEFTETTTSDPNFVPVTFTSATTVMELADSLVAAFASTTLDLPSVQTLPNGQVYVGGALTDLATIAGPGLQFTGTPGVNGGSIRIPYEPTAAFTSDLMIAAFQNAIRQSTLDLDTFNPGGGTLLVDGASSIDSVFSGFTQPAGVRLPPVSDLAGGRVRETRVNDETRFTIIMPDVRFDFGDAPIINSTLIVDNGARHTVSNTATLRLGSNLDTEADGQPINGDDDLLNVTVGATGGFFSVSQQSGIWVIDAGDTPSSNQRLVVTIGGQTETFELVQANDNPAIGNIPIRFGASEPSEEVVNELNQAITAAFGPVGTSVLAAANGRSITLEPIDDEDGVLVKEFAKDGVSYLVFTDNPNITGNLGDEDVTGFINPSDLSGSTIPIFVTGTGLVDIWIDFAKDGFGDDDKVVFSQPVSERFDDNGNPLPNLVNVPRSNLPLEAFTGSLDPNNFDVNDKDRWMRVRLSQSGDLTFQGVAVGGEVEDTLISIAPFDPPVPEPDSYTVMEDTVLTVDTSSATPDPLTGNDRNAQPEDQLLPVRYFIGELPQNGQLIEPTEDDELNGSFTYIPNPDFVGTDTFTYRLSTQRNSGVSVTEAEFATVTITVTPVNDPPGGMDQVLVATEFQPGESPADQPTVFLASDLLAGATGDADIQMPGLPFDESNQDAGLRVISVTVGGVTIDASNPNATGITTRGGTVSAEFVTDPADPLDPNSFERTYISRVLYQGADYFNSDNLRDPADPPLLDEFSFTVEDDGLFVDANGDPAVDSNGNPYPRNPETGIATARIRVTPQNSTPSPQAELVGINNADYRLYFTSQGLPFPTPTEDQTLVIPSQFLLDNDLAGAPAAEDENQGINDNDGNLRITSVSMDPALGQIAIDPTTGDLLFTPADDIYGQVIFSYEVEDEGVDENIVGDMTERVDQFRRGTVNSTIFVEPVNDEPIAYDRSFSVVEAIEQPGVQTPPATLSFTANDLVIGAGVNPTSPITSTPNSITVPDGATMIDGETVILTDSVGRSSVIEFSTDITASVGTDVLVTYNVADTADQIAADLQVAMAVANLGGVVNGATVTVPVVTAASTSTFTTMIAASANGISIPDGASIQSGELIRLFDTNGNETTVELSTTGSSISDADIVVTYTTGESASAIMANIRAQLSSAGIGSTVDGSAAAGRAGILFNSLSLTSINDASSLISVSGATISLPVTGSLIDGETITLTDSDGTVLDIEFNTTGVAAADTEIVVQYSLADSAADIVGRLLAELRSRDYGVTSSMGSLTLTTINSGVASAPVTSLSVNPNEIRIPDSTQLIDGETVTLTVDGNPLVIEFNTSGVAAAGTDYLVTYSPGDISSALASNLAAILAVDGFGATDDGDVVRISNPNSVVVSEIASVPGGFDALLPSPYNEDSQTLRVVEFATSLDTFRVTAGFNGEAQLATENGLLRLNFTSGIFTFGSYEPNINYNELPPFDAVDLFTYRIADDGITTLPGANLSRTLPAAESVQSATVTITVQPANDQPFIEHVSQVDISEDPAGGQATIDDVFTKVLPGPDGDQNNNGAGGALDELVTQGRPVVTNIVSTDPNGVMAQDPVVTATGALTVFPNQDAVGQVVYVFTFTDDHPTNPQSTDVTVTVNVRAVNDAPRFDPNIAGTGGVNGVDDAYSVARQFNPATGEIVDATITYTLREDNSQPVGSPDQPYFIPFQRDVSIIGYNPVGLLDVFTVGPDNEASLTVEGGGQTLDSSGISLPPRTALGGTLTLGTDGLGRQGVFYDPPQDFNRDIDANQPVDSFEYFVTDDGTTYVGSALTADPQTSSNFVQFVLNPVNDRPQFQVALPIADPNNPGAGLESIETVEDSTATTINNFAFGIEAGPPATAFDEVRILPSGDVAQPVRFSVTSLGFPESEASQFFSEFPTVTPDGTLNFRPAEDVFGSFDFELVLTDDGPGNETRGDLISSLPVTFTIDVLPVNDPPVVAPGASELRFQILETDSLDIPNNGVGGALGLLDVMVPGPANEGPMNTNPGGNQTIRLNEPTPVRTAFGGTVDQIIENNVLVGLRYTPRANFVGTDSFIYTVVDDGITIDFDTNGLERSDPRIASNTVTIEVGPVNNPPQFSGPSNVTVSEDGGAFAIDNWATNVFPGPPTAQDELATQDVFFTITQTAGPSNLFSSVPVAVVNDTNNTATLEFEPAGDANGVATFEVQLFDIPTDGTAQASSAVRTFTLRIDAVNDPPTFDFQQDPVTVSEDSGPYAEGWATSISPGPSDESDQSVQFAVSVPSDATDLFQSQPAIADDGTLRFIPAANANGTVDLTVTAIDSAGAVSDPVTLRLIITAENDRPVAVADQVSTTEDAVLTILSSQLLANDVDPDIGNPADTLTLQLAAESVSLSGALVSYNSATGQITYDPTTAVPLQALSGSQTATDSFTYSVIDSAGLASNVVTVSVDVTGINDAPIAIFDNPTLNPDGPTVIEILANDSDVDGDLDPSTIEITLQPAFGAPSIQPDGTIIYSPFQSFTEEDQFRYRVADNDGAFSGEVLVTISANAAPIAGDDLAGAFIDEFVDINVILNDVDPNAADGAPNGGLDLTSIQITSAAGSGTAVPQGDGTIRYIPIDGFVGTDSFQYSIADTEGRFSSPATVQVRVVSSRLQNPDLNPDVNDDGDISPIDALLVINRLARDGSGSIPVTDQDSGAPFYDVDGNQLITPLDALRVINALEQRNSASAEGEQIVSAQLNQPVASSLQSETEDAVDTALTSSLSAAPITTAPHAVASPVDETAAAIDLIAAGTEESEEDDSQERLSALDAAFGDLM